VVSVDEMDRRESDSVITDQHTFDVPTVGRLCISFTLGTRRALGDYLVHYMFNYASSELRATLPSDPMELVKFILKFCLIHSQR
jgi:hypothetical protein